tara:strand:- start:455 stop:829 length:375 start_codon:yes stop_codon:yes gene_type:complete
MNVNNYLWYPYLRYQQECRENGKEDSIQEWLELTGKVVPTPKKVTPKKVTTKTPKSPPKKKQNIVEKVVEKVTNKTSNTKRVRNRNAKGHFVKDDPNTPENEAWKEIEITPEIKPKTKRKRRKK